MATVTVPPELLDGVFAHFRPLRVILFGSAARGEVGLESDIDLLVVVDDDAPPEILGARSVYEARSRYHGAVDIPAVPRLRVGGALAPGAPSPISCCARA